jgi:hypothetical protein
MAAESRNVCLYVNYTALKRKFCSRDKTVGCVLLISATQGDESH